MFALPLSDIGVATLRADALGFANTLGVLGATAQGAALGGSAGLAGVAVALLGLAEGKTLQWLQNTALSAGLLRRWGRARVHPKG
jgi:hypothetical protein